ncbi:MAG: hypothetical protein Q7S90_08920 [Rubrivivax sp.]|nr:hypothetical protein [Rubrivivax sp.]
MSAGQHPHEAPRNAGHRHWHAGVALAGRSDWSGAARAFDRATRAAPQDALYWVNLAHAQRRGGAPELALAATRRALLIESAHVLALQLQAQCLSDLHRYAEAVQAWAALEQAGVREPEPMVQHASMLQALGRHREAMELLLQALSLKPDLVRGHALLADACRDLGLKREAAECMKTVLALEPDNLEALSHLSYEKRQVCDWSDLDADLDRFGELLATAPHGLARIAAAFGLLSLPLAPDLQLTAARGESLAHAVGVVPLPPVSPAERAAAGRLPRLGWLSYDFREHPVSQLIVELLEGLAAAGHELMLYSAGPDDGSALRQRVAAAATAFVDIRGLSDRQVAERVRSDGVDLLVDLMGHTRGHRLAVFAHRPAPLQVAFLGYPASTGAPYIDYLIGDADVTPLELAPLYSEKLAQLPLCFQPNGRWRPLPQAMTRADAGLPEGAFVMCAFNHTYKVLPAAFDAWCQVLRAVPRAVLWLKETNGQLHDNVRREAQRRGIDPARIAFAPVVAYEAHFSRLALADIFVDTWPYNAHTTASDALWAGVPVVTRFGNTFASRVAASVLNAAGLPELAMADDADYVNAITALALDPALLAGYRRHLVEQRLTLPLFDSDRYGAAFAALLQRMWQRWAAGQPAAHLPAQG